MSARVGLAIGLAMLLAAAASSPAHADAATDSAAIVRLASAVSFGVPQSPAFELLPERPDKITDILTPNDFQANLASWIDHDRIRLGVAADARPFVRAAGGLAEYRANWWRQAAFRTVLAAATSRATSGSKDVVTAVGVRIPLIDQGDSRADPQFGEDITNAMNDGISQRQPELLEPLADYQKRLDRISSTPDIQTIRDRFARSHWNAWRADLGFAGSVTSANGSATADSTHPNQAGVWAGVSGWPHFMPLSSAQLHLVGKAIWSRPATDSAETLSELAGARLRGFWTEVSLSFEAVHFWSRHQRQGGLDQQWNHYAAIAEWRVPQLGGWLAVAYGGDTSHRGGSQDQVSFRYALVRHALLSP